MSSPADALHDLAGLLRADGSVVSPHVADPEGERPVLGELAAAGERTAAAPAEYALVVEAVREGYLLHYGEGRVVHDADADLALLAGDYLYALGLERLAELGDLDAVRELSDLISLSAQVHDGDGEDRLAGTREAGALWLASAIAIAIGPTADHQRAKASLRASDAGAAAQLWAAASAAAVAGGLEVALREAADSIDFGTGDLS